MWSNVESWTKLLSSWFIKSKSPVFFFSYDSTYMSKVDIWTLTFLLIKQFPSHFSWCGHILWFLRLEAFINIGIRVNHGHHNHCHNQFFRAPFCSLLFKSCLSQTGDFNLKLVLKNEFGSLTRWLTSSFINRLIKQQCKWSRKHWLVSHIWNREV